MLWGMWPRRLLTEACRGSKYRMVAHQAVKTIETRVQPASWDGQMPWTMVIFPAGSQTNDTQLSSGDLVVMTARVIFADLLTEAGTLQDRLRGG